MITAKSRISPWILLKHNLLFPYIFISGKFWETFAFHLTKIEEFQTFERISWGNCESMLKKEKKKPTHQTKWSNILLACKWYCSLFWEAEFLNTFKRHISLEISPSAMLQSTHQRDFVWRWLTGTAESCVPSVWHRGRQTCQSSTGSVQCGGYVLCSWVCTDSPRCQEICFLFFNDDFSYYSLPKIIKRQ